MHITAKPWRIVLVPRPLPLDVAFTYFVVNRANILGKHYIRWSTTSRKRWLEVKRVPFESIDCIIDLNVAVRDLEVLVDSLIDNDPVLRRMKNFFFFHGRMKADVWEKWLIFTGQLSYHSDPELALESFCNEIDLLLLNFRLPDNPKTLVSGVENPFQSFALPDCQRVPMPVSKAEAKGTWRRRRKI